MRTRNRSIVFGLLTFSIPQLAGTAAGHYLLGFSWTASALLASMFASHTLLAYPIVSRLGLARREPVVITVGGTIITDTLALLVLAVVADSTKGAELGVSFWLTLVFGICGLVFLVACGVPMLTRWFFKNVTESGGAQFLFVLVVVCGCAYLSHFAKMEPIIGAFLVGAAFSRLIPEQSALMNRLLFVGNTLFIPFFLISVGMLVDVKVMATSPRSWLVATTMPGPSFCHLRLRRQELLRNENRDIVGQQMVAERNDRVPEFRRKNFDPLARGNPGFDRYEMRFAPLDVESEDALFAVALDHRVARNDGGVLLGFELELDPDEHAGLELEFGIGDLKLHRRLPGGVLHQLRDAGDLPLEFAVGIGVGGQRRRLVDPEIGVVAFDDVDERAQGIEFRHAHDRFVRSEKRPLVDMVFE